MAARPDPPANDFELKCLLIDLVKEHPLIYDKSDKDHFRSQMRTEVWHEIGGILDIPGELVLNLFCARSNLNYQLGK